MLCIDQTLAAPGAPAVCSQSHQSISEPALTFEHIFSILSISFTYTVIVVFLILIVIVVDLHTFVSFGTLEGK